MKYFVASYEIEGIENISLSEVVQKLAGMHTVAVDVETRPKKDWTHYRMNGLDPYTSDIVMLQLGDDTCQCAIDMREVHDSNAMQSIFNILKDSSILKVGQNIKFDYKQIYQNLGVRLDNVADTMVLEQILHCGKFNYGYSLEKLSSRYLNFTYAKTNQLEMFSDNKHVGTLSKNTRNSFKYIKDKPFTFDQVYYGLTDVEFTYRIYQMQLKKIARYNLWRTMWLEHAFLPVLAEMELAGMPINVQKWTDLYRVNLAIYQKIKEKLNEEILKLGVDRFYNFQASLLDPENLDPTVDINLASSKQVIELCRALYIDTRVEKKSKKKDGSVVTEWTDSVEARHLEKYRRKYPIVDIYLSLKRIEKSVTTYGLQFISKHQNPVTGRIHANYRQILKSGRIASANPNMQNIPGSKNLNILGEAPFRDCFCNESPWKMLCSDYSSQESRILADISEDENMISFFLEGDGDLHSHTARLMFKVPVSRKQNADKRYQAKVLNFGIPYGMSEYKLANDFKISLEEAEEFIKKWFASYPGVKRFFAKKTKDALDSGFVLIDRSVNRRSWNDTLQSRYERAQEAIDRLKYYNEPIPSNLWSDLFRAKGQIERNAQNYPIQGTGASMTKLAAVVLLDLIKKRDLWDRVRFVNLVHDEIVLEVLEPIAEEMAKTVSDAMLEAGSKFVKYVPMLGSQEVSHVWEH